MYTPESPVSSIPDDAQAWLARELEAIQTALNQRVKSGSAAMYRTTPVASSATITVTPTKITNFESKADYEDFAYADVANSTIEFTDVGQWIISVSVVFAVTPSTANTTREVAIDLFNETDSSVIDIIASGAIARYGERLSIVGIVSRRITEDMLRKKMAIRVYSPSSSTIAVTQIATMDYFVHRVSA